MNASLRGIIFSQFTAWLIIAIVGFFYLFTFKDYKPTLREDRINFGIDLVGGTYMTLEVQVDKAIEAELSDKLKAIQSRLKEDAMQTYESHKIEDNILQLGFSSIDNANQAADIIKNISNDLVVHAKGKNVDVTFTDQKLEEIKELAVRGNIEVLNTRLNALGVGEVGIAQLGEKNIVVELPDVDDPQKAKAMIGKSALLELKLVENAASSEEELLDEYDGELPDDLMIVSNRNKKEFYLVPKYADLTGRSLKNAYAQLKHQRMSHEWGVTFVFNQEGGDKFYELTNNNLNRRIAIIIDDVVISAPVVQSAIRTEGFISGNFSAESAKELAMLLKSGAFVAPVTFEEERQIGPSLGQESIHKGLVACLVGLVLLVLFSIFMYKISGFYAFLALLLNLLFILIALSWLRATLTLPGIAGMVLTVGMAIDASILIFERIKEELASGVTSRKAVQSGFKDAMAVILDSNITTFLVGIVLYKFGTGAIQGFAVTMMVGIISTLITGLFFLRSVFNFSLYSLGSQKLNI